jgi:hypothetical protein
MRKTIVALACGLLMVLPALAQSDLSQFPLGTTEMGYRITSDKLTEPEILSITVTGLPDGRYRVRMTTEATGTPGELGLFGFLLGMTTVRSGIADIDLSPLAALFPHRGDLVPGEDYILPGQGTFHASEIRPIAGVPCLVGTYTDPDHPHTRTTIAFSLEKPLLISPLIRVERIKGEDREVILSLELISYSAPTG